MGGLVRIASTFKAGKEGTVAISTAIVLPVLIGAAVLGIDFGYLTLQKRELQSIADLAAITAASNIDKAEEQLLSYFALNGQNIGVSTEAGTKIATYTNSSGTPKLMTATLSISATEKLDGTASFVLGRYAANPEVGPGARFAPSTTPQDAVNQLQASYEQEIALQ